MSALLTNVWVCACVCSNLIPHTITSVCLPSRAVHSLHEDVRHEYSWTVNVICMEEGVFDRWLNAGSSTIILHDQCVCFGCCGYRCRVAGGRSLSYCCVSPHSTPTDLFCNVVDVFARSVSMRKWCDVGVLIVNVMSDQHTRMQSPKSSERCQRCVFSLSENTLNPFHSHLWISLQSNSRSDSQQRFVFYVCDYRWIYLFEKWLTKYVNH